MNKKTLFLQKKLLILLLANPCNAQTTFMMDPGFSNGDLSVDFIVSSASGGSGILTATTSDIFGLYNPSTGGHFGWTNAPLISYEAYDPLTTTWSYTGSPIIGQINGYVSANYADSEITLNVVNGVVTANPEGVVNEATGVTLAVSDTLDGLTIEAFNPTSGGITSQSDDTIPLEFTSDNIFSVNSIPDGPHDFVFYHHGMNFEIVPEPSSSSFFALSSIALLTRRKR